MAANIASVLMSMGMMMLPPIIIALPFKIIFFVLVDGWFLIVGSLVQSFNFPSDLRARHRPNTPRRSTHSLWKVP
jgi:predicted membrane channel-forming protein YqfA (hemolysin III family)